MIINSRAVIDRDQKCLFPVLNSSESVSNLLEYLNAQIEDMTDPYWVFSFPEEEMTVQIPSCCPQNPIIDYSKREYSSLELVAHCMKKIEY